MYKLTSCMEGRIREGQVKYIKHILDNEKQGLLNTTVRGREENLRNDWMESTCEFMKKMDLTFDKMKRMKIRAEKANQRMEQCKMQRSGRQEESEDLLQMEKDIKQKKALYKNVPSSEIMYRARTNNLQLNDRERHKDKDVKCIVWRGSEKIEAFNIVVSSI